MDGPPAAAPPPPRSEGAFYPMLVSCPTCPAEYDVDPADIGPEGRVVECSNCGARWHQPSPAPAATPGRDETALPGLAAAKAELDAFEQEDEPPAPGAARYESLYGDEDDSPDAAGRQPSSAEVRQLRAAQAASHPRPRPEDEAPGLSDALRDPRRGTRALPEAARLNAELRASADEEERLDRQARGGFRTGLYLIVLIGLIAIGGYHGRDFIAAKFPPAAPYLDRYATAVDDLNKKALELIARAVQTAAPVEEGGGTAPAPTPERAPATSAPEATPGTDPAPAPAPAPAGETAPEPAAPQQSGAVSAPDATRTADRPTIGGGASGLAGIAAVDDSPSASGLGAAPAAPALAAPASPTLVRRPSPVGLSAPAAPSAPAAN